MITCELSGHELLRKMPTAQRPSQALLPGGATLGESPGGQGAAVGLGELELPGGWLKKDP